MAHAPLKRFAAGALVATVVAGPAGLARGGDVAVDHPEVVVYFDDATVSLDSLKSTLNADCGLTEDVADFVKQLYDGDDGRLSAVVFEVPDARRKTSRSKWRSWVSVIKSVRGVVAVEANERFRVKGAPAHIPILDAAVDASTVQAQPALGQVNAAAASNASGEGVTVAVLDGGFSLEHAYLDGVFLDGYDAIDDDNDPEDLGNGIDDDGDGDIDEGVGHGTFVSGLIHAAAPDAAILPIRVLDDEAWSTNLALWLGISKAVSEGADVINLSLVAPTMPQALENAIDAAVDDGIAIVVSAGNDPLAANAVHLASNATVVGGVDADDALSTFSPTGAAVNVYAPAEDLVGPIGGSGSSADSYGWWDGTSFAAAFVSAAAALKKELQPAISSASMITHLSSSTSTAVGVTPSTAGVIDLDDASDD